jgi:uncharacterized NAD(P)/FAD-binding protein YdhS
MISITIIGMGPRGLSVFERIAAQAREWSVEVRLNLVHPGACGARTQAPRLPHYQSTPAPAGAITFFPHPGTVALEPACVTPTLAEWVRAQGYRRFGRAHAARYHRCPEGGHPVGDEEHLPRRLLARYLVWAYGAIAASMPPTVQVCHLRHRVVDMFPHPDGSYCVELASGFVVPSDAVVLATGPGQRRPGQAQAQLHNFARDHARYNARLRYLRHADGLEQLAAVGRDAEVAIDGAGVQAHDVLAELTQGRGGRFESLGAGLRYVAGGQEPAITLLRGAPTHGAEHGVGGRAAQQLAALQDAGVLRLNHASDTTLHLDAERAQFALAARCAGQTFVRYADVLVDARAAPLALETDAAGLMRNLLKRGIVQPWVHGGKGERCDSGIAVDQDHHPLDRAGRAQPALWALGCLADGAPFPAEALPQQGMPSMHLIDAERCVQALLRAAADKAPGYNL